MRWTTAMVAVALYVLWHGSATPTAQENVISPGGVLVERQVLNDTLTAQRALEVYQRPERQPLLPVFWKDPESAGVISEGEQVRIISVKETSLWWDRLVWLELERADNKESVWFRIGPEESASAALWVHWGRSSDSDGKDRQERPPQ